MKPPASRSLSGRKAHAVGASFEHDIWTAYKMFAPPSVYLAHTSPHSRVVGSRGNLTVVYDQEGKGLPDFHGGAYSTPYGCLVSVVFDAKVCSDDRWAISKVTADQGRWLDKAMEAGAVTGILLRFQSVSATDVWLPWDTLDPAYRKTLTLPQALEEGTRVYGCKWWEVVR